MRIKELRYFKVVNEHYHPSFLSYYFWRFITRPNIKGFRWSILRIKGFPGVLWDRIAYLLACFLNLFCPYCADCSSFINPRKCKLFYARIYKVCANSCYMKQTKVDLTVHILNFLNHCLEKSFGVDSGESYYVYMSYKGKIFRIKEKAKAAGLQM